MSEQPVVSITGERVALGPLRKDLLPTYHRWENDIAIHAPRGIIPRPFALEQLASWYDEVVTEQHSAWFTIYELATWRPLGLTWWDQISYRDGTATYSIFIGEAEARGRGYGTEVTRLMLDYAFTALGLHNVMLTVAEFNAGARRSYEKAGFREFGRRTQSYNLAGRRWDDIYMQCLATGFESPVLRQVFAPPKPG